MSALPSPSTSPTKGTSFVSRRRHRSLLRQDRVALRERRRQERASFARANRPLPGEGDVHLALAAGEHHDVRLPVAVDVAHRRLVRRRRQNAPGHSTLGPIEAPRDSAV